MPQLAILSYLKMDSEAMFKGSWLGGRIKSSWIKYSSQVLHPEQASASCSLPFTHFGSDNNHSDGLFTSISDLYDVLEASVHKLSDSKANLVMDVVRAKCKIFFTQKMLADCILWENEVFTSLLKF
ncbi:uncharacterized protein BJ212DRAFT_1304388 [Suillus subaureus]|uniref:Uncharacterized protein n=1 Tax=Suillus subaureus TaxID=48587 RepID=A0A9P7J5W4_9AGAM|nr:uncharacterized protein BJ212DRAFT_1304388 [Suillus subaureus]KAG1804173.1 hypothetical protein BJ212DRAFT_1304388 [Suillus subaureus]